MKNPTFVDGLPDEATAARALSHPVRRKLLDQLHADGPRSSKMLAESVGMEIPRVNHHVRALERARFVELIETVRRGNIVEFFYRARLQAQIHVWVTEGGEVAAPEG